MNWGLPRFAGTLLAEWSPSQRVRRPIPGGSVLLVWGGARPAVDVRSHPRTALRRRGLWRPRLHGRRRQAACSALPRAGARGGPSTRQSTWRVDLARVRRADFLPSAAPRRATMASTWTIVAATQSCASPRRRLLVTVGRWTLSTGKTRLDGSGLQASRSGNRGRVAGPDTVCGSAHAPARRIALRIARAAPSSARAPSGDRHIPAAADPATPPLSSPGASP